MLDRAAVHRTLTTALLREYDITLWTLRRSPLLLGMPDEGIRGGLTDGDQRPPRSRRTPS
jgi:hypothetical protein